MYDNDRIITDHYDTVLYIATSVTNTLVVFCQESQLLNMLIDQFSITMSDMYLEAATFHEFSPFYAVCWPISLLLTCSDMQQI